MLKKPVLGLTIFTAIVAVPLFAWLLYITLCLPGFVDFWLRKDLYADIVSTVKDFPLEASQSTLFQINKALEPSSIKPVQAPQLGVPRINAERNQHGEYIIQLITADNGHAGFHGYVFSERPLEVGIKPELPNQEGHQYKRINENWFSFSNYER